MLIKKHKKTLQCILGSSLLCSCLCLHTLSFVDFHWTCNWMRWEPFNALFFPLYHQSWYFIFSKLNHWILQSPSIASRAMNVFFKCTEISFLILFISDCISLSLLLLSFRSFCMFSEIPFSCQSNHCLLATISFIWKLTKSGTDCPREVATQLQVMLRQGLYYWPGNAYVVPQSSHWCNVKREEGSGTQGRERKTFKKCPYRLLRSSLLCNHFSKMYLYAINDPEEYFIVFNQGISQPCLRFFSFSFLWL